MARDRASPRRPHSAEFREEVLAACRAPGAKVAGVAAARGLHPSVVHGWRKAEREKPAQAKLEPAPKPSAFVELPLPASAEPTRCEPGPDIRIELRRGGTTVNVHWPGVAADACAAWLREWLQ